jgi:sugar lactone lactonase YvrE
MSSIFIRSIVAGLACVSLIACGGSADGAPSVAEGTDQHASGLGQPLVAQGAAMPSPAVAADPAEARFRAPQGVAVSADGDLYIADTQNYTIRRITPQGRVITIAGMPGVSGSQDGTGSGARFTEPRDLAIDQAGNVYVTDGTVIRKISPAQVVTTMAGVQGQFGYIDGVGATARFRMPKGIAVSASGDVYVADSYFDGPYVVRRISPAGVVTTFAGGNATGSMQIPYDDVGNRARFAGPTGLAVVPGGDLFVTDIVFGSFTGSKLHDGSAYVRRISPDAAVTTVAGNHGYTSLPAGGPLAQFTRPTGIAVDRAGNIFVTDRFNDGNRIQKLAPDGSISVLPVDAGNFGAVHGLAADTDGNIYVTDTARHTIGRITPDGRYTVYAGKPGEAGTADTP